MNDYAHLYLCITELGDVVLNHIVLDSDLEGHASLGDVSAFSRGKPIRIDRRRVGELEMNHAFSLLVNRLAHSSEQTMWYLVSFSNALEQIQHRRVIVCSPRLEYAHRSNA